jgi:hypothetical protein
MSHNPMGLRGLLRIALLPHTRFASSELSWKRHRLLYRTPFSVTKYRTKIKSVLPLKPVSTKSTFRVSAPSARPLFSWRYHLCSFIKGAGYHTSVKYNQNIWSHFRKNCNFHIYGLSKVPLYEARIFVFTGHRPMMSNRSSASEAHTYIWAAFQTLLIPKVCFKELITYVQIYHWCFLALLSEHKHTQYQVDISARVMR